MGSTACVTFMGPSDRQIFFMDFITSKATFQLCNCCAMRLNRACVVIHSYNGSWCLVCKCTVEQAHKIPHSNHQLCAIQRVLLTEGYIFAWNHVIRKQHYGQFCSLLWLSEDLRINDPSTRHFRTGSDVKICPLSPRMLFQVFLKGPEMQKVAVKGLYLLLKMNKCSFHEDCFHH